MQSQTEKILKKHLAKDKAVILGLSGGPDSVYLLHLLLKLRKRNGIKIVAAHVNHGLRGKESDLDEKFVRALAKKHRMIFECARMPESKKGNLEENARDFRYAFFEKMRVKHGADRILTAHHRDDSIETALFNVARGSGVNGVSGIASNIPEKHLLRPLLDVAKEEIVSYLKKEGISFRHDASNDDISFSRNRIRKNIIPEFRRINPGFDAAFSSFMASMSETADFIDDYCRNWLKENGTKEGVGLKAFLALPEAAQKNILAELYVRTHGDIRKFNRAHLSQVLTVLRKNRANLKKEFGDGCFIVTGRSRSGGKIFRIMRKLKNPKKPLK
jgi:tRNA(Ile)-lysidine synthase